jgi:hypothetical protein
MNDELGQSRRRWKWEQQRQQQQQQQEQEQQSYCSSTSSSTLLESCCNTVDQRVHATNKKQRHDISSDVDVIDLTNDDDDDYEEEEETKSPRHNCKRTEDRSIPLLRYPSLTSSLQTTTNGMKSHQTERETPTAETEINHDENNTYNFIITVLTWNIWFGPPHPHRRMEQIASIISNQMNSSTCTKPMLIGFQEVTLQLSTRLFPLLQSEGYTLLCQPDIQNFYGCAIAVLDNTKNSLHIRKSGFVPFTNTIMGRGLLWVLVDLTWSSTQKKKSVLFATTHLESFVPTHPETNQARQDQLQQSVQFIEQLVATNTNIDAAFLTGDFNWDDERHQSSTTKRPKTSSSLGNDPPLLPFIQSFTTSPWIDAFLATKNKFHDESGFTYDAKSNPMLKGGYLQRRFDRCLIQFFSSGNNNNNSNNTNNENNNIIGTNLYGKEVIPGITWDKESRIKSGKTNDNSIKRVPVCPSDHYALAVTVKLPKA